jgi:hypothetical protein
MRHNRSPAHWRRTAALAGAALALVSSPAATRAEPAAAPTARTSPLAPDLVRYKAEIAAAMRCLDDYMNAFNARDATAFENTFNFPSVRIASNKLMVLERGSMGPQGFNADNIDWDHSAWTGREVIHAGPDKVHIATRFTRYRKDGTAVTSFDSLYVVTNENGHWGIKARSSYAP